MAKLTTLLHCGKCETGIVKLIVSKVKRNGGIDISAITKKCDKCGAFYALKELQELKQVEA
jgi:hypothetical protein